MTDSLARSVICPPDLVHSRCALTKNCGSRRTSPPRCARRGPQESGFAKEATATSAAEFAVRRRGRASIESDLCSDVIDTRACASGGAELSLRRPVGDISATYNGDVASASCERLRGVSEVFTWCLRRVAQSAELDGRRGAYLSPSRPHRDPSMTLGSADALASLDWPRNVP